MNNPWILHEKYHNVLPLQHSTPERFYYLPEEITLKELLKQINIGGLKIHPKDIDSIDILNYNNKKTLDQNQPLREIIKMQELPYLQLEI